MNKLEHLISRFLDNELSSVEERELRNLLENSKEASSMLRDMERLRSLARNLPTLSTPSSNTERLLFERLFAETSGERDSKSARPFFAWLGNTLAQSSRVAVPAIILIATLSTAAWFAFDQSDTAGIASSMKMGGPELAVESMLNEKSREIVEQPMAVLDQRVSSTPIESRSATYPGEVRNTVQVSDQVVRPQVLDNALNAEDILPEEYSLASTSNDGGVTPEQLTNVLNDDATKRMLSDGIYSIHSDTISKEAIFAVEEARNNYDSILSARYSRNRNHDVASNDQPLFSASMHHGVSYIDQGSTFIAQETQIRLQRKLSERHRVTVALGNGPLIMTNRVTSYLAGSTVSSNDDKGGNGPSIASSYVEDQHQLSQEYWGGVGYGYSVINSGNVEVEASLGVGLGEKSTRLRAELPVHYAVSDRLGLNLTPSIARVLPHDKSLQSVGRSYDSPGGHYLEVEAVNNNSFTAFSLQVGLSIDL